MTLPLTFQLMIPVPNSDNAPFAALGVQCDEEKINSIDYLTADYCGAAKAIGAQNEWHHDLESRLRAYLEDPESVHFRDMLPRLCDASVMPINIPDDSRRKMQGMVYGISCGKLLAYSDIASAISTSNQNIGLACGKNRIGIIVPCFRVVGKHANTVFVLGGYSKGNPYVDEETGLRIKRWLLEHEGIRVIEDKIREMSEWKCIPKS